MAAPTDTDQEIEEERQEALADFGEIIVANFLPGSKGCHEALHTAYLMTEIVGQHLLGHPAIVLNPDWYRRASRAVSEIAALYQDIGGAAPVART